MKMDMCRPATAGELAEIAESPTYKPWTVAKYANWVVRINNRDQGLPGRTVVWLNRHVDEMELGDLYRDEMEEFRTVILPDLRKAISTLWPQFVRLNVEWLGNEVETHRGHGHFHVTPRYKAPVEISTHSFIDENCNARRKTPKLALEDFDLLRIRDLLRGQLGFSS